MIFLLGMASVALVDLMVFGRSENAPEEDLQPLPAPFTCETFDR